MNCCIDLGNTRMKVAFFDQHELLGNYQVENPEVLQQHLDHYQPHKVGICSVSKQEEHLLSQLQITVPVVVLNHHLSLPFESLYKTPVTLGVDRIAAVAGAQQLYPGQHLLVIDAGTCITYDFIDADRRYHGGIISPGFGMRLRAMHQFTASLPSLTLQKEAPLVGQSTAEAMHSGVINGTRGEIESIIRRYEDKFGALQVITCGGDSNYFESSIKRHIFAVPYLVLIGLNTILLHNEQIA